MAQNNTELSSLAQFFNLLSDKTRLQIIFLLTAGESNVTALCKELKLAQPTVSHHLGLLRMNRLIFNKRKGKEVIYSLVAATAKVSGGKLKVTLAPYSVTVEGF